MTHLVYTAHEDRVTVQGFLADCNLLWDWHKADWVRTPVIVHSERDMVVVEFRCYPWQVRDVVDSIRAMNLLNQWEGGKADDAVFASGV